MPESQFPNEFHLDVADPFAPVQFTGQIVESAATEIRDQIVAALAGLLFVLLLVTSPAIVAAVYRAGF